MSTESRIDAQLEALEYSAGRLSSEPFERLLDRDQMRSSYEAIAREYLDLRASGAASEAVNVKVLHIMDRLRSPDIAQQAVRVAKIGPTMRTRWESGTQWEAQHETTQNTSRTQRTFSRSDSLLHHLFRQGSFTNHEELDLPIAGGQDILDFRNVVTLHMGFVGNDLVVAADTNLELFCYGESAVTSDRKLDSRAFRDYRYDAKLLDPQQVIFGPLVIPDAKVKIRVQLEHLHQQMGRSIHLRELLFPEPDQTDVADRAVAFLDIMRELELLMGFNQIEYRIRKWVEAQGKSCRDICIVIAPDDILYLLPLPFLGSGWGLPLITEYGGVTIGLSMMSLKWAVQTYHWITRPNYQASSPRCTWVGVNGEGGSGLDLLGEAEAVKSAFGVSWTSILGDQASRLDFFHRYNSGDICWFAGHGQFDSDQGMRVGNRILPIPHCGPVFSDGVLTNWDFIATSNWNFKSLWLTVMNCCVLGQSIMVGPNPLGFISALHTVGNTAVIAASWPVVDQVAIVFADKLAQSIVANYHQTDFPRARALSDAIRESVGDDRSKMWQFACYALWGLP